MKNKGDINLAIDELKNDANNAVAYVFSDPKNENKGKLDNVVITIKDVYATNNAPTQASSKLLEGFQPKYNATVIEALKSEGAIFAGKVHCDELALGGTGLFSAFGVITNPLDNARLVGGSSSGSAATFTKNIGMALGSDTGDSVRLPASYNGIVGFKPSYGSVSRFGLGAFATSLDTVAWFTHNVHDAALVSNVLFFKDGNDLTSVEYEKPVSTTIIKPKKIAYLDVSSFHEDDTNNAFNSLLDSLREDGVEIEVVKPRQELLDNIGTVYDVISFSEASSNDANLTGIHFGSRVSDSDWEKTMIDIRTHKLGKMVKTRFTMGSYFLHKENIETTFNHAQKVRRMIVDEFNKIYSNYDALIFPTAVIAPKIVDGKKDNWYTNILAVANFAGAPSISIPWTQLDNMPINLSVESLRGNDAALLGISQYIENIIGGTHE